MSEMSGSYEHNRTLYIHGLHHHIHISHDHTQFVYATVAVPTDVAEADKMILESLQSSNMAAFPGPGTSSAHPEPLALGRSCRYS